MSTSANIRHLRATKGMTQEQLAMLVGVSRQAIAKWEAGGTYPETEKLIRLSQIFECSLDDIITGDLTSRPIEAAAPAPGAPQDICGYDQAMRSFAMRLACGVAIILLAIGVGLLLEGFVGPIVAEGVICLAFVLAGVAAGVAIIVPACIRRQAFNREHPFVEDFYTTDDRAGAGKLLGWGIGGDVALILAGVLLCELLESWKNFVGAGTLLVCIGLGVWLLVYAAVMHGRLNVESYNLEIAESMSYQAIDEVISTPCCASRCACTSVATPSAARCAPSASSWPLSSASSCCSPTTSTSGSPGPSAASAAASSPPSWNLR